MVRTIQGIISMKPRIPTGVLTSPYATPPQDVAIHSYSSAPNGSYDSCIVSRYLSNIPNVILTNFRNMLSFEHHVYFVNVLIIIWLSKGGKILVSLAIDHSNHVMVYGKAYNTEDAS